jgi:AcrR family transcriptional regulator
MDLATADADAQQAIRRRASMLPPEERRSMIVEATLPLLVEHGEMVTTRQIADAAGIAEGTIFRVFADKDELITAVLERAFDPQPLDDAIRDLDPGLAFEAALRRFVELQQKRALEIWRIASAVGPRFQSVARPGTAVSPHLVAWFKAHRGQVSVSPAEAARLLRGLTISLTHPSLVEEPMTPKRIVELFLHGAGAAPC